MVSAPAALFAATIASRSEQSASQAPSLVSAVFVTVKVLAWAGLAAIRSAASARAVTASTKTAALVGNLRVDTPSRLLLIPSPLPSSKDLQKNSSLAGQAPLVSRTFAYY